jgi:AcrR family transcriptional regulator
MLTAAGRLFAQKGYARTTFQEIAADADVSVATVFNYFPSKEDLVEALLRPDLERILARGQRVIDHPPADAGRAMVRLLSAYSDLGGPNWESQELLRLAVLPGIGNAGALTNFVNEADARTQAQIRDMLIALRKAGRLLPRLPIEDAAAIVFALLNHHYAAFLTQPSLGFRNMFRMLARRVRLVFADWQP